MRSLLFVPGDSEKKLAKSLGAGADVLILDLEDSIAPDAKAKAREIVRDFLRSLSRDEPRPRLYVRVNALSTGLIDDDLDAVLAGTPEGIMLPKSGGGADVIALGAKLAPHHSDRDRDRRFDF